MAGQQQQIVDTIFNMKKKILRRDDSDTEEPDSPFSSNKQDLRRNVSYARASDSDFLSDPHPYKKRIEHAGYHRFILQRNPPRFDAHGDIVEPGDEYDEEDDLEAVEENPYGNIQLENLLAPLTSAADLANHPALNVAYTSTHLTDLASEAGALSRKERVIIASANNLLVKLQGDSLFAPDALAARSEDPFQASWANGSAEHATNGDNRSSRDTEVQDRIESTREVEMVDEGQANGGLEKNGMNGDTKPVTTNDVAPEVNGVSQEAGTNKRQENGERAHSVPADDDSDTASQHTPHRMTTRARAQAASTPSPPQSPSSGTNIIHPIFTFSADSLPDRDLGIPASEAEETRMLLMAYVQKQEEIARITSDLHQGLLQADRMRQEVFKSCKAEGHLGEMSDGEDWYDNEEWGLEQDLIKGRDEEDDDAGAAGKKSTRQRRKPEKEDR